MDFQNIKGQAHAKRALEVAASGRHSVLLVGPADSGKSLLSEAVRDILPEMTPFQSVHYLDDIKTIRTKLHASGGGVLVLDHVNKFNKKKLAEITQNRTNRMIIATMRLCPCGNRMTRTKECTCTVRQVMAYFRQIEELVREFSICVELPEVRAYEMKAPLPSGEASEIIARRVYRAAGVQEQRFKAKHYEHNALMPIEDIQRYCLPLDEHSGAVDLLNAAIKSLSLTLRDYDNILRVSRTVADMDDQERIKAQHIAEAVQYRMLDCIR